MWGNDFLRKLVSNSIGIKRQNKREWKRIAMLI